MLRRLPVAAPSELVRVDVVQRDRPDRFGGLAYGMVGELLAAQRTLVDISGWLNWRAAIEERDGTLRYVQSVLVTGNAFDLLGLRPRIGRLIDTADDVRGGPSEGWPVVLSDIFWRDNFGRDPNIIGKPLRIAGNVFTVVGVTPSSFHGVWPGVEPSLYAPLQFLNVLAGRDVLNVPQSRVGITGIGRLRSGATLAAARADLLVHEQRLLAEFAPREVPDLARLQRMLVESAQTGLPTLFRRYSAPLYLMQGLVAIVLLLCCVNVGGLMLSKLHERRHEFAVRTAIGAAGMRIARQYLTEAFLIALAGAALGAAVAWYGTPWLLPFFRSPMEGVGMKLEPDQTVFLVTATSAVLTTLFFGGVPAWRAGRADPAGLMTSRTAAQRATAGRGFVAIQVALSLVLVTLAALLSQSMLRLQTEPTGFDLDHVTIQTAPVHVLSLPSREATLDFYDRMVERISRSSSIQSAAVTWYTPMTGFQSDARFEALETSGSQEPVMLAFNSVGAGYFRTMATKILSGREFETRERRRDVCVLNESAAGALFPGQSALERYVRTADPTGLDIVRGGSAGQVRSEPVTCRVVGVAEDAKFGRVREAPPMTIYFPLTPDLGGGLVFLLNSRTKAGAISAYREALREIAPTVPLVLFATLREQMNAALGGQRAITMLSVFFGIVALLLSALGLYGMLASSVSQRRAEIGVRTALGATRASILRMIVIEALRLAAIGAALGAAALFVTVRFIDQMLYGVTSFHLPTLIAVGLVLTVVVLAASFWPARRAASVDPIAAMRAD